MSEEKKEELTQEEKDKIEFNKQLKFAQGSVSSKNVGEISSSRSGVSFDQLQSALQDPYSNVAFIQQVSKILYASNGIYYRLIENFTNIPMYDLYLSPTTIIGFNGKSNTVDKMNKEYEQIAQLKEKINYKYNFKWFGRQLLLYGELFLYNDGPNIDNDMVDDIFNPFKKGIKGQFGLGLSIVKKTLNLLNYDISIENSKKGVSFIIKKKAKIK